jgi:spore germination protein KB
MTNKPVITSTQLMFLFVGSSLMFPYTFLPVINSGPANQDTWIVALMAIVYVIILFIPLLFLINKFKGATLNEFVEKIMGKFIGKVICFIFSLFFLFCYSACMLMILLFVNSHLFPQTPIWYTIITIIFFFVMGIDIMDLNILKPVLKDSSFWELNRGAFLTGARVSEIFIIAVFSVFLDKKENINKITFKSILLYLVLFLLILFPTVLVLGIDVAKHSWNPYFLYTRLVRAYDFIQRVEALNTLAWLLGSMLKLSIYSYMASQVLSDIFNIKSYKKMVIPVSVLAFIVCSTPALVNSALIIELRSDRIFPWIVFPVVFVLPVIIVIVYFIKNIAKKLKQKNAQKT